MDSARSLSANRRGRCGHRLDAARLGPARLEPACLEPGPGPAAAARPDRPHPDAAAEVAPDPAPSPDLVHAVAGPDLSPTRARHGRRLPAPWTPQRMQPALRPLTSGTAGC